MLARRLPERPLMMNLSFRQVKLYELSRDVRFLYDRLIYPKSYDLFDSEDRQKVLCLVAFIEEEPIGLIACFAYTQIKEALLSNFFVLPQHQNQGIGTRLMGAFLSILNEQGIHLLYFTYPSTTPYLEKILQKTGWKKPELLTRRYFLDQYSFHPDWFFSPYPLLSDEFTLFPWSEIEPEELEMAKKWEQSQISLHPFTNAKYPIDALTSLGLRQKGKLAGWMVNHRLEPKLLRYSSFYLIPEIRGRGPGIYLLKESIRLHLKNEIDLVGMMEINFKLSQQSWIHFIQNRLAPYAYKTEDIKYAYFSFI